MYRLAPCSTVNIFLTTLSPWSLLISITATGGSTTAADYNSHITTALIAANTAITAPSLANTNAAISALGIVIIDLTNVGTVTSAYAKANIQLGLIQLNTALTLLKQTQS